MPDPIHDDVLRRAIADARGVSRRDLLNTVARLGLAIPIVGSGLVSGLQAPSAPRNPRIIPWNTDRPVIRPTDLSFLGFIRFPSTPNIGHSGSTFAMRKVNGEQRFFITGNTESDWPVLEYSIPDQEPHPDLNRAPIASFRQNWGAVFNGLLQTGSKAGGRPGGIFWDEDRQILWWSYGDGYVPVQHHPTIGATLLRADGTTSSYGPWRTEWNCQRTRGGFIALPEAFAAAFTNGRSVGIMAPQQSGNATSPFGASLSTLDLPDPFRTAPDVTTSQHWTIRNQGLLLHDIQHRQARDTRYRNCGWRVQYDCSLEGTTRDAVPLFGGSSTGVGENDTMTACVWVDLPDKHGLVYFGQLVTTPEGYSAPGDPDGLVHMWYGNPVRTDGWPVKTCCHFQDDPWWQATGPGAHYRVSMGWIYNPSDLVATAQGSAELWSRTPTSTFQWKRYLPQLLDRYPSFIWGSGGGFDKASRRVYVTLRRHDDVLSPGNNYRPVALVFQVK